MNRKAIFITRDRLHAEVYLQTDAWVRPPQRIERPVLPRPNIEFSTQPKDPDLFEVPERRVYSLIRIEPLTYQEI